MATIAIKNIGPLADTGVIELKQFNIFIGKQSTGKSTLMKILCFCQWVEKKIMTGDDKAVVSNYTHYTRFLKEMKQFHRLNDSFFTSRSEIHYQGECITIDYVGSSKNVKINRLYNFEEKRHNTKLCFIPSERNLTSAIKNVDRAYKSNDNDVLFNHIFEWSEAKEHTSENNPADLSIVGEMDYFYDKATASDIIRLKDKRIRISPFYASSGVQSILPIIVMIDYFTRDIFLNSTEMNRIDVSEIFRRIRANAAKNEDIASLLNTLPQLYNYQNTRLFIEEPEQNLFPESQKALIEYIVRCINRTVKYTKSKIRSSVVLTTHSPYVITAFNTLIKAEQAAKKNKERTTAIISEETIVHFNDVRAFYIHKDGTLSNILDDEMQMISGIDLDRASEIVEDTLSRLNDIIYGTEK